MLIPLIVGDLLPAGRAGCRTDGKNLAATAIFIFAGDHRLARRLARAPLNQMSAFGAFLDPVADKLMVVGALIVLLHLGRVDALVALIIIGREIAISALREWMAKMGQAKSVAVAFIGKIKTVRRWSRSRCCCSTTSCFGLSTAQWLGTLLIYVAAVLTVCRCSTTCARRCRASAP